MILKVCGMKDENNMEAVGKLSPDMMGFIFFEKSPRYVSKNISTKVKELPSNIKKVGVFVNTDIKEMISLSTKYALDYVQLHGNEGIEVSKHLKQENVNTIKVFSISNQLPKDLAQFVEFSSYFLFDTKSEHHGGSGKTFDWSLLSGYDLPIPYLLSGGISLNNIQSLMSKNLPHLEGIDVNSCFEDAPGIKNIDLIKQLKTIL